MIKKYRYKFDTLIEAIQLRLDTLGEVIGIIGPENVISIEYNKNEQRDYLRVSFRNLKEVYSLYNNGYLLKLPGNCLITKIEPIFLENYEEHGNNNSV